jgi:hypothetical protein
MHIVYAMSSANKDLDCARMPEEKERNNMKKAAKIPMLLEVRANRREIVCKNSSKD